MKNKLSNIPFALLCAVILLAALGIGAVRGWSADRAEVLAALTQEGEMRTQLEYRGMDAANLAVVAARHLPADDADLIALRNASAVLLSGTEDPEAILSADAVITRIALQFAQELPLLPSMQASSRDQAYVTMLTSALGRKNGLTHSYTLLVEDFNTKLTTSLTGRVAMLLGVDPLPVPEDN